jgi:hypothetical protein
LWSHPRLSDKSWSISSQQIWQENVEAEDTFVSTTDEDAVATALHAGWGSLLVIFDAYLSNPDSRKTLSGSLKKASISRSLSHRKYCSKICDASKSISNSADTSLMTCSRSGMISWYSVMTNLPSGTLPNPTALPLDPDSLEDRRTSPVFISTMCSSSASWYSSGSLQSSYVYSSPLL